MCKKVLISELIIFYQILKSLEDNLANSYLYKLIKEPQLANSVNTNINTLILQFKLLYKIFFTIMIIPGFI